MQQGHLVNKLTATHAEKMCGCLHLVQHSRIDHSPCFTGQGRNHHHIIGPAHVFGERRRRYDRAKIRVIDARAPAGALNFKANSAEQAGDLAADATGTHDEGRTSGGSTGFPMPPLVQVLQGAVLVQLLVVGQYIGEHEFCDWTVKEAMGVGEHDVGPAQLIKQDRVHTGGRDVHPLEGASTRPGSAQGGREEVPEQEYLGELDSIRQADRIRVAHVGHEF